MNSGYHALYMHMLLDVLTDGGHALQDEAHPGVWMWPDWVTVMMHPTAKGDHGGKRLCRRTS